ncbi:MAG: sialidase family protein [Planctomycetota bacterium]|jgi:hypothetical protein
MSTHSAGILLARGLLTAAAALAASEANTRTLADELAVDLLAPNAAGQWCLPGGLATIEGGELLLDGRRQCARAFYLPWEWEDVTLQARFMVEPQPEGVLACGFVVRAVDAATFYYVHFDRAQAILVRSDPDVSWNEIQRTSGLDKPAGEWHEGKLQCSGHTLRVCLNGNLLYEARDETLRRGRIGFYANQGRAHVKDVVVSGKAAEPSGELVVPKPRFVTVCDDAGAGAYEAFPDVCRLKDGRLMCVFYAGYGHVAMPNEQLPKGGRVSFCTSADEGRTWTDAQTLHDGPDDDRDPSICQLKDGRLICNYFSLRPSNEPGQRWTGLGAWAVTSDDVGKSWSEPRQIAASYGSSAPVRELSDGRLILGLYSERAGVAHGAVTLSDDGGRTWSEPIDIDNAGAYLDAETDVIELPDGRLYAAQRGGKGAQMHWSVSDDRGKTWSVSRPIGFDGHCPYLHRAGDGVVLLAHRLPATSLHYSLDECLTWSANVEVDTVGGAYPSMVNLTNGSVLIVYYEEGAGSNIRAKRFRALKTGIEWLTFD